MRFVSALFGPPVLLLVFFLSHLKATLRVIAAKSGAVMSQINPRGCGYAGTPHYADYPALIMLLSVTDMSLS